MPCQSAFPIFHCQILVVHIFPSSDIYSRSFFSHWRAQHKHGRLQAGLDTQEFPNPLASPPLRFARFSVEIAIAIAFEFVNYRILFPYCRAGLPNKAQPRQVPQNFVTGVVVLPGMLVIIIILSTFSRLIAQITLCELWPGPPQGPR
ncbi:hypothetical protein Y032_0508g2700 [Ancylostoma ceylanicum]|uniref:Uncharacterized protein n=1 Tax=Ancylostoma ceylanicum TaxID=53326 RepID=A0A016WUQ4_9BILA|nr:hypothetical protein Y032_0508g2700 [Ancylostoma ceylanicum]